LVLPQEKNPQSVEAAILDRSVQMGTGNLQAIYLSKVDGKALSVEAPSSFHSDSDLALSPLGFAVLEIVFRL
jgi:hypothetical protein